MVVCIATYIGCCRVHAWIGKSIGIGWNSPRHMRSLASAMLGRRWQERGYAREAPIRRYLRGPLAAGWAGSNHSIGSEQASYRSWLRAGVSVASSSDDVVRIGRRLAYTDPTRDRRVVELMHSLPAFLLAGPADRRRIFDSAFGDLLPKKVLRPTARGLQNVDWHHAYHAPGLRLGLDRYATAPIVRDMIDCRALADALDHWPTQRTTRGPIYEQMVWGVLPALSIASFLYTLEN